MTPTPEDFESARQASSVCDAKCDCVGCNLRRCYLSALERMQAAERKVAEYERNIGLAVRRGESLTEFDYRRAKQEAEQILDSSMRSAALETVCLVFLDAAAKVEAWGPIVQRMLEAHHALSLDALPPGHGDELAGLLEALKPEVKP